MSITVIDNFIPDAEQYREAALKLDYRSYKFDHCTFHGIAVTALSGRFLGALIEAFPQFKPTLTFFRKSPLGQPEPNYIHTDIDMGKMSAILYLNENPPKEDGTLFWEHSATKTIGSTVPHLRSREGDSTEGWTLYRRVEAKFNRLLLFPSDYFHSRAIAENWGEGDDARLTQIAFGEWS